MELIVRGHGPRQIPNSMEGANGFVSDFFCYYFYLIAKKNMCKRIVVYTVVCIILLSFLITSYKAYYVLLTHTFTKNQFINWFMEL